MGKRAVTFTIAFCLWWSASYVQHPAVRQIDHTGKSGISAVFQPGHMGMHFPFWFAPRFSMIPGLDFCYVESAGLDMTISLASRHYFHTTGIMPYLGFRIGTMLLLPAESDDGDDDLRSDLLAGVVFGGEYFITSHISIGIELQGNFFQSDERSVRFDNPGGTRFQNATVIIFTFYMF